MTAKVLQAGWLSATTPLDEEMLRELLAFDCQCSKSIRFTRDERGQVAFALPPSTMHWSRVWEWPWAIQAVTLEGKTVLHAGGGHCVMTCSLAKRCQRVELADLDKESIGHVVLNQPFKQFDNIGCFEWDLTDLPACRKDYYDVVQCVSVLEHIPDWRKAMSEMMRVLKPGGHLVLTADCQIVMAEGFKGPLEKCPHWDLTGMGRELVGLLRISVDPNNLPMVGLVDGHYYTVLAAILEKQA